MVSSARACGFFGALACLSSAAARPEVEDSLLLLQLAKHFRIENEQSCTPLKNQGGTYFSVKVCVGTPPQCFDTVADTGSDSLIIPSCICGETQGAGCSPDDKCYRGTNTSSTFRIPAEPLGTSITYGSGTVSAIIATDKVKVGNLQARMKDGVLLMIDRSELQIDGPFEGILGLGIPQGRGEHASLMQQIPVQGILKNMNRGPHDDKSADVDPFSDDIMCEFFPELCQGVASGSSSSGSQSPPSVPFPDSDSSSSSGMEYEANLFMQAAQIKRFSMCFRDSGDSGALRMNVPEFDETIPNIGTYHWGIDFRGLSVGQDAVSEAVFCGQQTMKDGMKSPCGIIPDSGTTQILGPEPQVKQLETELCKKWDRCNNLPSGKPSSNRFRKLLLNCAEWLTDDKGLLEIPSVFFHMKHAKGGTSSFELTAWAWVTETSMQGQHGQPDKICESAFGVMDYITEMNGPIWIVGTPLFYEFNVGYDMVAKEMALSPGRCQACNDDSEQTSNLIAMPQKFKMPRRISGQRRAPYYNTSIPL